MDYEEVKFKEILTSSQFGSYISGRAERLRKIEERLVGNDKRYLPHLNAAEERLRYYQDDLIPSFRKNLLMPLVSFNLESEKVNYLKSKYKKFLVDSKKQILIEHFRHSKTLQPALLKLSLLRHKEMYLFPDYFVFKETFDIATKAIADFLIEMLSRISENLSDALRQSMDELKKFNTNNTAKHIGEIRGWYATLPINNKTEEFMFVLLLDPKKHIN